MITTFTGKWPKKKPVSNVRESVRVCPKITACLCSEVPEVHRDDGRTPAAPRRSLTSRNLPLFQMQHLFLCPLPPVSFLDQHLQVGRIHIHGKAGDESGRFTLVIPWLVDFSDGCWSGRGQIRRRWRREIPGIPVSIVRNVTLIRLQQGRALRRRQMKQMDTWPNSCLIPIFSGRVRNTQYAVYLVLLFCKENDSFHRLVCFS